MSQPIWFATDKPLATGIKVLRSISIFVLVMILLVFTLIGVLGLVLHFKERQQVVLPKLTGPYAVGRSLFSCAQRIYGLACGYADANDAARLAEGPSTSCWDATRTWLRNRRRHLQPLDLGPFELLRELPSRDQSTKSLCVCLLRLVG